RNMYTLLVCTFIKQQTLLLPLDIISEIQSQHSWEEQKKNKRRIPLEWEPAVLFLDQVIVTKKDNAPLYSAWPLIALQILVQMFYTSGKTTKALTHKNSSNRYKTMV